MLPTEIPTQIAETGTALADIAIATVVILAGMALAAGAYLLSLRIERRLERRPGPGSHLIENAIVAIRRPLSLGIALAALYIALRWVLGLERLNPWLADPRLPEAVAIVLVTWGVANFLSRLVLLYGRGRFPAEEREDGMSLADLVALSVKYLVWFVAILYLLIFLDISITPLIAGAGIAGIAIALAAQDVLSNLFGGVIILLDKPLRVGDKVRIDPYTGTVLRLGLRSTRIRTLDGQLATVPNNRITTNIVVNYTAGTGLASVQVPVTVAYDRPVEESRAALREIAEAAPRAAPDGMDLQPGNVQLSEFGRFGPVFVMTFSARDDADPLVVRDLVNGMIADSLRNGRLAIGFDHRAKAPSVSVSDGGGSVGGGATSEHDEER